MIIAVRDGRPVGISRSETVGVPRGLLEAIGIPFRDESPEQKQIKGAAFNELAESKGYGIFLKIFETKPTLGEPSPSGSSGEGGGFRVGLNVDKSITFTHCGSVVCCINSGYFFKVEVPDDAVVTVLDEYKGSFAADRLLIWEEISIDMYRDMVLNLQADLRSIPEEYVDQELCTTFINMHNALLQAVPDRYRTRDICTIAVRRSGTNLENVPLALRDREMCELALSRDPVALAAVPAALLTDELCFRIVSRHGQTLQCLPPERRTVELCRVAVRQDYRSISSVPPELLPHLGIGDESRVHVIRASPMSRLLF